MKKTILFVDDESLILTSFRRMLSPLAESWQILFAENGFQALDIIGRNQVDVVISDMQMPGMNGCQLLKQVSRQHPQVVLVMLTGQPDMEKYNEAIDWCHYFLSKPIDLVTVTALLDKISPAAMPVKNSQVHNLLCSIPGLASPPPLYVQIKEAMNSHGNIDQLITLVDREPAFVSPFLRTATISNISLNSATLSTAEAIHFLGSETVQALALLHLPPSCLSSSSWQESILHELWEHSYKTASIARDFFRSLGDGDHTFLAGVLHDIGKFVQLLYFPETYCRICKTIKERRISYHEAEKILMITNHIDLGVGLLQLWELPQSVVEVLSRHHSPPDMGRSHNNVSSVSEAVWYANQLSHATKNYERRGTHAATG